jgi:hypothetical protein
METSFFTSLTFCYNTVAQLREIHPSFSWHVMPEDEPRTCSMKGNVPSIFFILCREKQKSRQRLGSFLALRCRGEAYLEAKDITKWLRSSSNKLVNQLAK